MRSALLAEFCFIISAVYLERTLEKTAVAALEPLCALNRSLSDLPRTTMQSAYDAWEARTKGIHLISPISETFHAT